MYFVFAAVKWETEKEETAQQKAWFSSSEDNTMIKIALASLHYCSHLFFKGRSINLLLFWITVLSTLLENFSESGEETGGWLLPNSPLLSHIFKSISSCLTSDCTHVLAQGESNHVAGSRKMYGANLQGERKRKRDQYFFYFWKDMKKTYTQTQLKKPKT